MAVLLLCPLLTAHCPLITAHEPENRPATPAKQIEELARQFNKEGFALRQATTDEEQEKIVLRVESLTAKCMKLAEANPQTPVAVDALTQVITQEIWIVKNTSHPSRGRDSPAVEAFAILIRDYLQSEQISTTTRRAQYGFRGECEGFLRTVLEKSPYREARGLACLRLAQFLNGRLHRLELLKERPAMACRYEGHFGKDYLASLQRRDRSEAIAEVEALLERAAEEFGDVKRPYGDTVGEQAEAELFKIRHLAVGREALDIECPDQDGVRFKLSDYRGKVVLLYFWLEY